MAELKITGESTMQEVIDAYPGAQRALFRKYHMGGCSSCGYQPTDKLAEVGRNHGVQDVSEILAFLGECSAMDAKLQVSVKEVAAALKGPNPPKLLDVRTPQEWEAARIAGARLFDRALNFEMAEWPKDTPVVFYCHTGSRSLDAASFFAGHEYTNVRSMDGGIDAWSQEVDPSVPRYEIARGPMRSSVVRPLSESLPG